MDLALHGSSARLIEELNPNRVSALAGDQAWYAGCKLPDWITGGLCESRIAQVAHTAWLRWGGYPSVYDTTAWRDAVYCNPDLQRMKRYLPKLRRLEIAMQRWSTYTVSRYL